MEKDGVDTAGDSLSSQDEEEEKENPGKVHGLPVRDGRR